MSVIINGTAGVTFPDSVLQTSGVPGPGTSGNVLTSNGTVWQSVAPTPTTTIAAANLTGTTLSANVTSSSLTALGNVTTGTWSANTIAVTAGGTGQTTYTNGQLLIGNTTGNTLTKATLTAGSGISITNGSGSISIAATGGGTVTSVATGNGLSGGTITSSGTLVVACPTFGSVGSYCLGYRNAGGTPGGNVSLNYYCSVYSDMGGVQVTGDAPPGTWKWMGSENNGNSFTVCCRVS